jgi:CheY-like chemotaxis protein
MDVETEAESLRILLVDDDDAVRGVISRVLVRLGHEVACCSSAAEATELPHVFDVALVDLNLGSGEGGGHELVETLRARCPKACFVLTSGARPDLVPPEEGGPLFLEKPFSRGELVELLERARRRLGPSA